MTDTTDYVPPKVWTWDQPSGGQFANINRPVAGPTHDKELPVGKHPLQLYSLATPNGQKASIMALRNYWRSGLVEWRPNRLTVALVLAGAVAGALIVQSIRPRLLDLLVPMLLVGAALYILLSPRMTDEDAHHRVTSAGYAPIGSAIGFYDGFFGPGAGTFYTTSLVALRGYGLTKAAALTKLFNLTSAFVSLVMISKIGISAVAPRCTAMDTWRPSSARHARLRGR